MIPTDSKERAKVLQRLREAVVYQIGLWDTAKLHNSFALRLSVSSCCLTPRFMPVPLAKLGGGGVEPLAKWVRQRGSWQSKTRQTLMQKSGRFLVAHWTRNLLFSKAALIIHRIDL
jgi:hypothetical protein